MIFLDSNVVVTFFADSHPHHERSHAFIMAELRSGTILFLSPQVIGEAFRALTSSQAVEHPISPDAFLRLCNLMLEAPNVQLISPGRITVTEAVRAAAKLGVTSHRIYDLLLYGTMREHGIDRIATFNEKHFRDLDGIELVPVP